MSDTNIGSVDYALFFLERIQGKTDFQMPLSPDDRDSLIRQILK